MSELTTVAARAGGLRLEKLITKGIFSLDGGSWEVDNNVWLVGTDEEVIIVDAAHDAGQICNAVGDRHVTAIICTHGHNDHINAADELGREVCAPVLLHPADDMLWRSEFGDQRYLPILDGQRVGFGGTELQVVHTPGHSPGSVCLYLPESNLMFSGDTLFAGGPGATGRSYSDFPTIIDSIRDRILGLPACTQIHPGHGASTAVSEEGVCVDEWIARGH